MTAAVGDDGGSLLVSWPASPVDPEGHHSTFSADFLRSHAYHVVDDPRGAFSPQVDPVTDVSGRVAWTRATFGAPGAGEGDADLLPMDALPSVPYSSLEGAAGDSSGLPTLLQHIRDFGVGVVTGCPVSEEATEAVSRAVGGDILMGTLYSEGMWKTEIRADGNDTAYQSIALPAHTDGCYMADQPGLQVFHCTKADASGGHTNLVDGFAVAAYLQEHHPDTYTFWREHPMTYHHTDSVHQYRATRPVFQEDAAGVLRGFTFNAVDRAALGTAPDPSQPSESMREYYYHLHVLSAATRTTELEVWTAMQPGMVIFIDNCRVLHGRSAFDAGSGRTLVGTYIARQDFESSLRREL